MQLSLLVRAYIDATNADRPIGRELAERTCEFYCECERLFSRWLGCAATTAHFDRDTVARFLKALLDDRRSAYTVKSRRTGLLVLWRYAHRLGLALPCEGVRPVACPGLKKYGYDLGAMRRLLEFVGDLRGPVRATGVPKAIYWDAFLRTDWEVGLRIGDMIRVEVRHFDRSGWLWFHETKTCKSAWQPLRPSTTASVAACIDANPVRERIWPGYTRKNIIRAFSALARSAGVNGTSKYIRSGGSSECDRLFPGAGWRHLRHSTPDVWVRHYRVERICEVGRPMPPELPG